MRAIDALRESGRTFARVGANRDLRHLEGAWAFSIVATWAYGVGLIVFAYDSGGARAVGLVGLLRWVTAGLVSPFAAVLGDRYDRRRVMIASDVARALMMALAAVVAYAGASAAFVYLLAAGVGVAGTPFRPAEAALTPSLAETPEELTAANVVASAIESVGIFAGPALGGVLLALAGAGTVFAVTAGGVVVSALLLTRIRSRGLPRDDDAELEAIRDELLAGVRAIGTDRKVAVLIALFAAQTFVDGIFGVLLVIVALKYLAAGAAAVGYLNAASGIGGVLAALVVAGAVGSGRLAAGFGVGVALFGLPLALVPALRAEWFVLLLFALNGVGNTITDVAGMTLLQRSAPDAVLARVFGVLESLLLLTVGTGAVVAPFLISGVGVRGALIATGIALPLLVAAAWPILRAIDREADVPVERVALLRGIPIFAPLPEGTLEELARALEETHVAPGEVVVTQGEAGERFYIVAEGSVDVLLDGAKRSVLVSGESFGEIALLRQVPRTATVRAREETSLLSLDRSHFVPAVTGYAPSLASADAVIGMRLGPGRAGLARA